IRGKAHSVFSPASGGMSAGLSSSLKGMYPRLAKIAVKQPQIARLTSIRNRRRVISPHKIQNIIRALADRVSGRERKSNVAQRRKGAKAQRRTWDWFSLRLCVFARHLFFPAVKI